MRSREKVWELPWRLLIKILAKDNWCQLPFVLCITSAFYLEMMREKVAKDLVASPDSQKFGD